LTCKCGSSDCIGFYMYHEKDLPWIDTRKKKAMEMYGNVEFSLVESDYQPKKKMIGEAKPKFFELHVTSQ